MAIEELPIFCFYDKQRFTQFGSMDCANWYGVSVESAKKKQALYPAMGRKHINFFQENRLIFDAQPREIFKTIDFFYVVVGTRVYQFDKFYNQKGPIGLISNTGNVWFSYLTIGTQIFGILSDETSLYLLNEDGTTVTFAKITDMNAPGNSILDGQLTKPGYVAAFGYRIVVSNLNTPQFNLTQINLGIDNMGNVDLDKIFTPVVFAQASGVIRQLGVLHAQLYIFNDFTSDIWANIPTQLTVAGVTTEFPWKLNSSYNWDYGLSDPLSLSIDFGRMVWLGKNSSGIVSYMVSNGQAPNDMDTQAINVLLEKTASNDILNPFLSGNSDGFLYQYENTIFYRALAGNFMDFGLLDMEESANAIEYNFSTGTWARVIELNGERNRIQKHIYFNNSHLVTVEDDTAIYEMAGNIYINELRTPNTNPQAVDAFTQYPMRYELVTKQLFLADYSEFIDDYVEIDFVFGDQTFYNETTPFVEPNIVLYYSDDGGITFTSADNRTFSDLGQYRWRMRWYELGISRNRSYKLVCVSFSPVVILGAVRDTRRASGGAN